MNALTSVKACNPLAVSGPQLLEHGPVVAIKYGDKKPLHNWKGEAALRSAADLRTYLGGLANVGLRLDAFFVVDVDGPTGAESLEKLKTEIGDPLEGVRQKSGSGFHIFFRRPGNLPSLPAKHCDFPQVDFKSGPGHMLVMGPSLHSSGTSYVLEGDLAEAPELPQALIERLVRQPRGERSSLALRQGLQGERHTLLLTRAVYLFNQDWDFGSIEEALWGYVDGFHEPWTPAEAKEEIKGAVDWLRGLERGSLFPRSSAALDIADWLAERLKGQVVHLDNGTWMEKRDHVYRPKHTSQMRSLLASVIKPALRDFERWIGTLSDEKAKRDAQRKLERFKSLRWTDKTLEALGAHPDLFMEVSELNPTGVLNYKNGPYTIDGEPAPWAVCTKQLGVDFNCTAANPNVFLGFLQRALPYGTVQTVLDFVGHALLRRRNSQYIWILEGPPAAGKSTFVDIIAMVLGDYSVSPDTSLLFSKGNMESNGPNEDLFALNGAAFAAFPEGPEGAPLNPSRCKVLAGGDKISTRPLYGHLTQFENVAEIVLVTNHETKLNVEDAGLRRRIKRIRFSNPVEPSEMDPHLKDKLIAEGEAIMNLLLRHAHEVREHGIRISTEVEADTDAMLVNQDILQQFIDERLSLDPTETCRGPSIYAVYQEWCVNNGIAVRNAAKFYNALEKKLLPIEPYKLDGSKAYRGVKLR